MATCTGECHGSCSVEASPPRCTADLRCDASAECRGSCNANAKASVDCSKPQASVVVNGDLKLQQVVEANLNAWAEAVNLTISLKDPAVDLASKGVATFKALGDIGVSGATCVLASMQAAAQAQAHMEVSVSASASFNASSTQQ
jgi:hypothetical protein